MNDDDVIKEVRAIRELLAARSGYSVRTLYEEAKRNQRKSDRKIVTLKPRLLVSTGARTG